MNRRFTNATIALVLALSLPAGAARAEEATKPAAPAAATLTEPAPPAEWPPPDIITSARAEAAVRALFTLPESQRLRPEWRLSLGGLNYSTVWKLQLTIPKGEGTTIIDLAEVDAISGRVLRYGAFGTAPGPVRSGALSSVRTADEARVRAWALVQKVAPEKAALLREAPAAMTGPLRYHGYGTDVAGDAYSFTWVEYHDGIPFPASNVQVAIHKQTLEPVAVSVDLIDSVTFRPGPAKVSVAEALKLWQAAATPSLAYEPVSSAVRYVGSGTTGYRPVYSVRNIERPLDAMTGAWVPNTFEKLLFPGRQTSVTPQLEAVPPANGLPVVPQALPLSDETAQQFAFAVLDLPQGAPLRADHQYVIEPGLPRFILSERENFSDIYIEAQTGLIHSAQRPSAQRASGPATGGAAAPKVTPEQEAQAKQAAFAAVNTYYSELREQLRLETKPGEPQEAQSRRFHFVRSVNGLTVPSEMVEVSIDLKTMKWHRMKASWSTGLSFPRLEGAITPDRATAAVLSERKPTLVYDIVIPDIGMVLLDEDSLQPLMPQSFEAALTYIMAPAILPRVDALTGQPLANDGRPVPDMQAGYAQAAGHWAEGELRFMLSRDIIRPDELRPGAALTRAQAAALLVHRRLRGYGPEEVPVVLPYSDVSDRDPAYGPVRTAWREGWLPVPADDTAFRPGDPVTRAEFAVWAARALAAGDLTPSEVSVDAPDMGLDSLTAEQRNAVSFLLGLGLLRSDDTFRGADPLTQAEGAALTVRIYNYLLER